MAASAAKGKQALWSGPARTYTYDAQRYRFDVELAGYGSIAVVALAVIVPLFFLQNFGSSAGVILLLSVVLLIGGVYTIQRTFWAHAYPRTVTVDAERIAFASFGRTDVYELRKLTQCAVRESAGNRTFVRIADKNDVRGRYFLGIHDLYDEEGADAEELRRFLCAQEERLDPDNIRVRARRVDDRKQEEAAAAADAAADAPAAPRKRKKRRKKR